MRKKSTESMRLNDIESMNLRQVLNEKYPSEKSEELNPKFLSDLVAAGKALEKASYWVYRRPELVKKLINGRMPIHTMSARVLIATLGNDSRLNFSAYCSAKNHYRFSFFQILGGGFAF